MTKNKSNKLIRIVTIALIIVTAISIISVTASAETTTATSATETTQPIRTYEPKPEWTGPVDIDFDFEEDDNYYEESDVPENEYVYTDINNDGILDENDIKELQQYLAEEELITGTILFGKRSSLDANLDGTVDVNDATAYQKLIKIPRP